MKTTFNIFRLILVVPALTIFSCVLAQPVAIVKKDTEKLTTTIVATNETQVFIPGAFVKYSDISSVDILSNDEQANQLAIKLKSAKVRVTIQGVTTEKVSHDAFTVSYENGLTDYVVLETKDLTAKDEYLRTIDWIKRNYNTPDEVIKAKIENEYIRIQGVGKNIYSLKSLGLKTFYDIRYQIEFHFKDGRIKFSVIDLESYSPSSQYSAGGWYSLDPASLYKPDGTERTMFKQGWDDVVSYLNNLSTDVKQFVLNPPTPSKSDW